MKNVEHKSFNKPDEVRTFEKGKVDLLNMAEGTVGLMTLQPGWQWSKHVKPIAKTELCEAPHFQYQLSGVLGIRLEDGTEFKTIRGDVLRLPAGHDAWVVGSESVTLVDWAGATHYAKG